MEIKRFDDFIICPIPAESELDQVEIEKIVAHTRNTWQHDRQNGEMRENTFHIESENIEEVMPLHDDLFVYRGLDEEDLKNIFLVAEYVKLMQN